MNFQQSIHWTARIVRLVLGALFIVAGVMKLRDPEAFTLVIDAFGLVSGSVSRTLSIVLPVLEIAAGLGLIMNVTLALHGVSALLLVFMAILVYGMHLGLDIDCGCYGPEDVEARAFGGLRLAFYRDLAMAAGLLVLYIQRAYTTFSNKTILNRGIPKEMLCEPKEPSFQE